MEFKDLVAVTGMSGIFHLTANRSNGLIVENLDSGKRKFISARKHQFTPLESISIYTENDDSIPLRKVFRAMLEQVEDNPPVAANSNSTILRDYFLDILPTHDRDKVNISDIKKVIKWFNFLNQRDMMYLLDEVEKTEEGSEEEE